MASGEMLQSLSVSLESSIRWCFCRSRLTDRARPVRHSGDEPLLFAGRLPSVAFILVGVSVGAAHWLVVFVALWSKHNDQHQT